MRITWVTRSFLDYRVPVFGELNRLVDGGLKLMYCGDVMLSRVCRKAERVLGQNSLAIRGERRIVGRMCMEDGRANAEMRIPYQPGLIRAVASSRPSVLISDGFCQWTYAALFLRALKGIPHVMCYERTAHTERNAQWYRKSYRRIALRWIDALCCSGRLCGEYVRSLGFPAARTTYGHMVADVEGMRRTAAEVTPAQTSELATKLALRGLVFLYVGRLTLLKGLGELLHAWEAFSSATPCAPATLLLVGEGAQRTELERFCRARHLTNVRFAGAVDYDALGLYYRVADAFIIPTLEDNWSLVVPEAMACGLPILCSKYNGCWPEYVTAGNGWVFDPLQVGDTCDCLRQCLQARTRLPEMGRRSWEIVSQHTAAEAAEAILAACRIAIGRHRPR